MSLLKVNTVQTDKLQSVAGVTRNSVLQVVSKEVSTEFSTVSQTFVDVTDQFMSITPTSATSKILVSFRPHFYTYRASTYAYSAFRILRDSTPIFNPYADTATPTQYSIGVNVANSGTNNLYLYNIPTLETIDSPNTTSEITYQLQVCTYVNTNSGLTYINFQGVSNSTVSTMTLMEIAQ